MRCAAKRCGGCHRRLLGPLVADEPEPPDVPASENGHALGAAEHERPGRHGRITRREHHPWLHPTALPVRGAALDPPLRGRTLRLRPRPGRLRCVITMADRHRQLRSTLQTPTLSERCASRPQVARPGRPRGWAHGGRHRPARHCRRVVPLPATGHSKQKDYGAEHPAESGPPQNPANAPIAIDSGTFAPACNEIAAVIAATRWTVRYKPPTSPTRPAEVMVR